MDDMTNSESSKGIWTWAEEAAERSMAGVESTPNEYQRAEQEGEKHIADPSSDIADAGDIAGG